MKTKYFLIFLLLVSIIAIISSISLADDGEMFRRNISKTPDQETERAAINHMALYVPAQSSNGTVGVPIEYYDAAGVLVETRDYAKPLVAVYIDALPEHEEEGGIYNILSGGAGLGEHDAYAALSLDDGTSWKRTNLSLSADLSSFTLADGTPFPGDAHNMTFAIAGDKAMVGWISRYCDGGSPAYTLVDDTGVKLYPDIWGVMGTQGSVDYTGMGFPEVGEIPFSCVWSARGTLLPVELDDTGTMGYDIIWTKAERLTSGRRDANRLEIAGDSAAGFMMVWQEDPEGLRPGQGLGPGEGWSGAVVNGKTDLWYSYISTEDFVMVQTSDDDTTPISIYEYTGETVPKVADPMSLPIRLTDNNMCKENGSDPYCYVDFSNVDGDGNLILPDDLSTIVQSSDSTLCSEVVPWTNPGGTTLNLCQAQDGRVMQGRVGASRPRVNVQPYDSDGDGIYDSAWVIMGAEESKALGEGSAEDPTLEPEDIGKNMWYYTFDMLHPIMVQQGLMLNQPAIDPETGTFFEPLTDDWGNTFHETEISRRFSHMSQPIHQFGPNGVGAVLIVKQGIINQGGPADIFLRLTKVPEEYQCETDGDPTTIEWCMFDADDNPVNPYGYEFMVCEDADGNEIWEYEDGSNPHYLEGLCFSNMINVSGTTIVACDNGTSGQACADAFPWDGGASPFPKVTQWSQTVENLSDQSWTNPYDVSKGHRGFIDGDFIMMMYAWSPNWQANSVGNDHYNLYARRSFDGGATWTTTPSELGGDGTETCENYKDGTTITTICTAYEAGEFEQARNLSQLIGNKETILDPRYTPTGGLKMLPITDLKGIGFTGYDDDIRDPSKFFIVYETGDNTTVALGEATPLDLFYSRATNWGDDYDLVEYYNSSTGEITLGFDWLEHDRQDLSGEASNTCNNAGTFYYVVWNQWQEDEEENVSNSDIIFRRLMYYADDSDPDVAPVASILYVNQTILSLAADDTLILVGSARGFGINGEIEEMKWLLKPLGSTMDPVEVGAQQQLQIRARELVNQPGWAGQPGWAQFQFIAKDKGGRWSPGVEINIWIVQELHQAFLPMVNNE